MLPAICNLFSLNKKYDFILLSWVMPPTKFFKRLVSKACLEIWAYFNNDICKERFRLLKKIIFQDTNHIQLFTFNLMYEKKIRKRNAQKNGRNLLCSTCHKTVEASQILYSSSDGLVCKASVFEQEMSILFMSFACINNYLLK